jgi:hypothetical protein
MHLTPSPSLGREVGVRVIAKFRDRVIQFSARHVVNRRRIAVLPLRKPPSRLEESTTVDFVAIERGFNPWGLVAIDRGFSPEKQRRADN